MPTLPTGPFELQLINIGLDPEGGSFSKLSVEVSASFGVSLGPFAASVDRLGVLLKLDLGGGTPIAFAFKPPNGIGLSLDAGIVKGGGYLAVDQNGYAGVLELKMLAVDVKAIALLNTHSEAGFSLLLLIFGQFPAIQLSFGFTLTGIGGLIGVQHTASPPALSQALSAGQLDAVLFPDNPVANAPQIINTLRTMFPVKAGGFIIGPMLELGWGTPSLVTVRLGLLIEASQFTLLGQAIVALPPLVSADLALLYLRLDFVGSVVFDPLRIAFDAKLIHSRVALHLDHRAVRVPRDVRRPADVHHQRRRLSSALQGNPVRHSRRRSSASARASTSASSASRSRVTSRSRRPPCRPAPSCAPGPTSASPASRAASASTPSAISCRSSISRSTSSRISTSTSSASTSHRSISTALLAGPGRWHIAGNAEVHTPWPLPDFSVHIDEHFGTDLDTPQVTVDAADLLGKEIEKIANWSAQLPSGGDSFLSLAKIDAGTDVLAHPLGSLTFQQKLVPFELRLDKASGSKIKGANEFFGGALALTQDAAPTAIGNRVAQRRATSSPPRSSSRCRRPTSSRSRRSSPTRQAIGWPARTSTWARSCARTWSTKKPIWAPWRVRQAAAPQRDRRLPRATHGDRYGLRRRWPLAAARSRAVATRAADRAQGQPAVGHGGGQDDALRRWRRSAASPLCGARSRRAARVDQRRRGEPARRRSRGALRMTIPYRFMPWSRRGLARAHPTPMPRAARSRRGRASRSA